MSIFYVDMSLNCSILVSIFKSFPGRRHALRPPRLCTSLPKRLHGTLSSPPSINPRPSPGMFVCVRMCEDFIHEMCIPLTELSTTLIEQQRLYKSCKWVSGLVGDKCRLLWPLLLTFIVDVNCITGCKTLLQQS